MWNEVITAVEVFEEAVQGLFANKTNVSAICLEQWKVPCRENSVAKALLGKNEDRFARQIFTTLSRDIRVRIDKPSGMPSPFESIPSLSLPPQVQKQHCAIQFITGIR